MKNKITIIILLSFVSICFSATKKTSKNKDVKKPIKEEVISIPDTIDDNVEIKIKEVNPDNIALKSTILVLNKITSKSYTLDVNMDESVEVERLTITPLFCWKSSPYQLKEEKVLLRIMEKVNEKKKNIDKEIFYGWMFSSSPSINSLENQIYDVAILDCIK